MDAYLTELIALKGTEEFARVREEVIIDHMELAVRIAFNEGKNYMDHDELPSLGYLGLLNAITDYVEKEERGIAFKRVLYPRVKWAVVSEARGTNVYLPGPIHRKVVRLNKFLREYKMTSNREPTRQEIMTALGVGEKGLRAVEVAREAQRTLSLEFPLTQGGEDAQTLGDVVLAQDMGEEEEVHFRMELEEFLEHLTSKQRKVFLDRVFGDKKIKDIAIDLGIQKQTAQDAWSRTQEKYWRWTQGLPLNDKPGRKPKSLT